MNLYICSTYYHVLISVLKSLDNSENEIAVTDYIPENSKLIERLRKSGLFQKVHEFQNYGPENKLEGLFWRRIFEDIKFRKYGPKVEFLNYANIYLFMDDICYAHYLKDHKIEYNVIEDGYNSFKMIEKSPFSYMVRKNCGIKNKIKNILFPLNYRNSQYYQRCGLIKSIEVNEKQGIVLDIYDERVIELPRKKLFDKINNENRNRILNVFLDDRTIESIEMCPVALILTYCFYTDGIMKSEHEQVELYANVCSRYLQMGFRPVIKPHPRDCCNYKSIKGASVIDRYFPAELVKYLEEKIEIDKYVSIYSSSVNNFDKRKVDYFSTIEEFYNKKYVSVNGGKQ